MAQVNNPNNMRVQNGQVNGAKPRESHSWSFDTVAKKDLNRNQWPFKVVRDKGKPTKMEIRSLTDLNRSFDGTLYNLNDCPRVKSRYSLLFDKFTTVNMNGEITPYITHLLLTYDSAYYLIQRKDMKTDKVNVELRSFTYASDCLKPEDLNGLCSNVLYRSKYLDNNIKQTFKLYNDSNDMIYFNSLRKDVEFYLNVRKKLRVLDNSKLIVDVLKSELNFTNLQYLIFMPYPEMAKDYQNSVVEGLMRNNIEPNSIPEMMEEIQKLPTLDSELKAIETFKQGLERKEFYRSIRKLYMLSPREVNKENVWSLFKSITSDKFPVEPIYISEAEQVRQKKMEESQNNKVEETVSKINTLRSEIKGTSSEILDILFVMNSMMKMSDAIHQKGIEINNVEYNIWINEYAIEKIRNKIDHVYNYNRNIRKGISEKYPISKIFRQIQENIGLVGSMDLDLELNYFNNNIAPTNFSDERYGLERFNLENINSKDSEKYIDSLKNLKTILTNIKVEFISLFETFLGVFYAVFGIFMKRYGLAGIQLTKMLIPELVAKYNGKPFNITEHVKENANIAFYMIQLGVDNLENYDPNTVTSAADSNGLGGFAHFTVKYLTEISGVAPNTLTHTNGNGNSKDIQYMNLMYVASSIFDILDNCKSLAHLNAFSEENIEKMVQVIEKNIQK